MNKEDDVSGMLNRALNILFMNNPQGTALGVLFGFSIDTVVNIFTPSLPLGVDKEFLKSWRFTTGVCMFGAFLFNIKPFLSKDKIPEEIKEAILFIEQQKKLGHITAAQAKLNYNAMINKIIESTQLKPKIQAQIKQVSEIEKEK